MGTDREGGVVRGERVSALGGGEGNRNFPGVEAQGFPRGTHAFGGTEEGLLDYGVIMVRRKSSCGGKLKQRHKLPGGGLEAGRARASIGGSASVPAVLHGEGSARLCLDGLCTLDIAGGCANDNVRQKIAALDGGLRVQKLNSLDLGGG